jgi:cytochrome c553
MIVRSRRKQSNFSILPNEALRDQRLSYKARGLLAFILSMPDDWATSSASLARMAPDGRDSVRAGLKELGELGYLEVHRRQLPNGRWRTDITVHEHPVKNSVNNAPPKPEKPTPENPAVLQVLTTKGLYSSDISNQGNYTVCGNCHGSRHDPDTLTSCPQCAGQGLTAHGNTQR